MWPRPAPGGRAETAGAPAAREVTREETGEETGTQIFSLQSPTFFQSPISYYVLLGEIQHSDFIKNSEENISQNLIGRSVKFWSETGD